MYSHNEGYKLVFTFCDKTERDAFLAEVLLDSHPTTFSLECVTNTEIEVTLKHEKLSMSEERKLCALYKKTTT